jgi:regulator of replication initiation timing
MNAPRDRTAEQWTILKLKDQIKALRSQINDLREHMWRVVAERDALAQWKATVLAEQAKRER